MAEHWNTEQEVGESVNFERYVDQWKQLHEVVHARGIGSCRHWVTRDDTIGVEPNKWTTVKGCWPPMIVRDEGKEMRIALCFECTAEGRTVKMEQDKDRRLEDEFEEGLVVKAEQDRMIVVCRLYGKEKDGEMATCKEYGSQTAVSAWQNDNTKG
ncbi:hypothetical protein K440DRAFT_622052 [Wilcoxina mikolae CBS 423.85]|nr:hypothetical protein K440DRAFT_622052 [Wilcoxina mikolae CBS 423.85]